MTAAPRLALALAVVALAAGCGDDSAPPAAPTASAAGASTGSASG